MKKILALISLFVLAPLIYSNIYAQNQERMTTPSTITAQTDQFSIEHMTCKMCPITVRRAIKNVDGVTKVAVDFDAKIATVVYDPAKTTPTNIAAASTNAGYKATPLNLQKP